MIHLVIYSSDKLKKSLEKTRRLRTNPHGNLKKSVEGVAIILHIAITLYGNKNLEEMRTISKIIETKQGKMTRKREIITYKNHLRCSFFYCLERRN